MKKKDPKEQFTYDEQATQSVSNQIMGAYSSGVIDEPDGQYNPYEDKAEEYPEQ
ncbi:hypothetical protein [Rossellomorea sp. BNER]|jgi:hypothetical protein|uniref:hypothetical protein n=1 Tax=Rossellomorea sp. BNER TaxID=2962031 RepID=UPI003AF22268|nr:hypothetical protein [Rossellomorea sp. BNER]